MKKIISAMFVFAALAVAPAMKAESIGFDLSNSDLSIVGTITLGASAGNGIYDIASISGEFTDGNLGIYDANISGMVGGWGNDDGGYVTSADGSWYYSNLVYYPGTAFDSWGGPLVNVGPYEVNWWSVGGGVTEVGVSLTGAEYDYVDFQYVTPEPGSLLLLGTGLLLLAGITFWTSKDRIVPKSGITAA